LALVCLNQLKPGIQGVEHEVFEVSLVVLQTFLQALIFYHQLSKVAHLLIGLSLEIAREHLRYFEKLLLLVDALFANLFILINDIFCNLLNVSDEVLFLGSIGLIDLFNLAY
jgi:hypothetical protein